MRLVQPLQKSAHDVQSPFFIRRKVSDKQSCIFTPLFFKLVRPVTDVTRFNQDFAKFLSDFLTTGLVSARMKCHIC